MRVSIELFLLDNFMMNYLTLRLAAVLFGGKARTWLLLLAAGFGALYALLSMAKAAFLLLPLPKLLLTGTMALVLADPLRSYGKALLCTVLSAFLMGGAMLGLTTLLGGGFENGVYFCTVPVRAALVSALLCALLPRLLLTMLHAVRTRPMRVRVRLVFADRAMELNALVDSGNLLTEPLSGLPVIVLRPGLLPEGRGRPVPYRTVDGEGMLTAIRPVKTLLLQGGVWRPVDAYAASAATALSSADAIVGSVLLTDERWCQYEPNTEPDGNADSPDKRPVPAGDTLYSLRGDAAAAVPAGAGTGVDQTTHAG